MRQVLIAVDQLLNVFFYSSYDKKQYGRGWGMADETISARSWRLRKTSWFWKGMCDVLDVVFFYDEGVHCFKSYMHEFDKHQLPPHYKGERDECKD